ncbi:MAG TPA: hypothetical protein P5081_16280 [Phycisphaerae bacterium]|nr:hypothetical protein [Phycisphaerae bacterium]HRW54429.1 hypothetical protein [Phycisphaerae bacterium]
MMKKYTVIGIVVLGFGVAAPAWLIAGAASGGPGTSVDSAAAPELSVSRDQAPSGGVYELIYARRFELNQPYHSRWNRERAKVDRGYLVAIRVAPEYVFPHEAATPVLYAGDVPIERINVGFDDGVVIGVIPGDRSPESAPIYFGSPDYPERVSAARGLAELGRMRAAGGAARSAIEVDRAMGVEPGAFSPMDKAALYREAGRLIELYAPAESSLAEELQAMP